MQVRSNPIRRDIAPKLPVLELLPVSPFSTRCFCCFTSTLENRTGRTVAAVNQRVAVLAGAAHGELRTHSSLRMTDRMALVAIVVDRDLPQEPLGGATVRIVTTRTGDLPLAYRHVRGAEELGLALL